MASIYAKTISGAGGIVNANCLIMAPHEVFAYPIPMPTWGAVRAGMFLSYTTAEGPNNANAGGFVITTGSKNLTDRENSFYFGFSVNEPSSESFSFAGMGYPTGSGASVVFRDFIEYGIDSSNNGGLLVSGDTQFSYPFTTILNARAFGSNGSTGMTGFYAYHDIELNIEGSNKTYILTKRYLSAESLSNGDRNARLGTGQLYNLLTGDSLMFDTVTILSGYYTTDQSSGGSLLPIPENALLYWPLYPYRLRIHNFGVIQTR